MGTMVEYYQPLPGFSVIPPPGPPYQMPLASYSGLGYQYGSPYASPSVSPPPYDCQNSVSGGYYLVYPSSPPQASFPVCQYQNEWQPQYNPVAPPTPTMMQYPVNQVGWGDMGGYNQGSTHWNPLWLPWMMEKKLDSTQDSGENAANEDECMEETPVPAVSSTTVTISKSEIIQATTVSWEGPPSKVSGRVRKRASSWPSAQRVSYCTFCKSNRETKQWYESHVLKSPDGVTCCPILRKYTCPVCNATGDTAHTLGYCPENPKNRLDKRARSVSLTCDTKKIRNSRGLVGSYRYK